jgi:hypothetical protein
MKQEQQDALRAPFAKEKIQKLPTGGLQLDYVSHAWVTDRLLEVDPTWTWEPVAFDEAGLPKFDENGGLWIKLTVCGVTRFGYGEPQGRDKFDLRKGSIGNAIRNASMRFGVALDLWAKESPAPATKKEFSEPSAIRKSKLIDQIKDASSMAELTDIVPLIQNGEFVTTELQHLRVIFDKKKAEFTL